jgi:RimJ/RimL family protein N-acetyltransferase
MLQVVSLLPLTEADHADALQEVYRATPAYWQMYELPSAPAGQAARDLAAAAATPGRSLMGIVRRVDPTDPTQGVEMVGTVDFRIGWPEPQIVYVAMIMVAEPYQRQGIGTQAWQILAPWLAQSAEMQLARTGVEQFNPNALRFFQSLGFRLSGASSRIQSGRRWVRLLYMEQALPVADNSTHNVSI